MNPETGKISSLFIQQFKSLGGGGDRLCVVLGAGADISSGGLSFPDLKRACLERFRPSTALALMDDQEIDSRFNKLLQEIPSESQRASLVDFLFHGFGSGQPSDGYKLLVLLAREGVVDVVITTNFDDLLEAAERDLKLDVFQVFAAGIASPYVIGSRIYLPPKPVYIKLHGDIRAQLLTHLTSDEIAKRAYDDSISLLVRKILSTHIVVYIGYSGNDETFAREVQAVATELREPIYWCNRVQLQPESPLGRVLNGKRITFVKATFEEAFTEGGVACLSAGPLLDASVQFVAPLLSERIRQINAEFISQRHESQADRIKLLVPRRSFMERIAVFRGDSEKNLAIITGISGVGKSTVLTQLCDLSSDDEFPEILAIRARSIRNGDFSRDLSERLGYASENAAALIFQFSGWLRQKQRSLILAIDGLNEYRLSTSEVINLFREILRLSSWFQYHGAIKVLLTVRPETWNELFSLSDKEDILRVLWTDQPFQDAVSALHLDRFDEDEMAYAYQAYAKYYHVRTPLWQISPMLRKQLSDPYLLALTMQSREAISDEALGYDLYRKAHQELLRSGFGHQRSQAVETALARLAAMCLDRAVTHFYLADLQLVDLLPEDVAKLKDINILGQLDRSTYCFSHERVHDCFLVIAINDLSTVRLADLDDLAACLLRAEGYPRLRSAIRQCFAYPPPKLEAQRTTLIFEALSVALAKSSSYELRARRQLHEFARETLNMIAGSFPDRFLEFATTYLGRAKGRADNISLGRTLLHTSCILSPKRSIQLIVPLTRSGERVPRAEATILLYDRISHFIWEDPGAASDTLGPTGPFSDFLFDKEAPIWTRLFRILGVATQVGLDNSEPTEWEHARAAIYSTLRLICQEDDAPLDLLDQLTETVQANANRYLFNATDRVGEQYFMSPSRMALLPIFNDLKVGKTINLDHIRLMRPYIKELGNTIEFVIVNLFFILSMRIDADETLASFEVYFSTFDSETNPEEIDFFLSALCMSLTSNGRPFHDAADRYSRLVLERSPQAFVVNPGVLRAQRSGRYNDPFDQQFEDGFNPLAFYFYNAPSRRRQSLRYTDYLRSDPDAEALLPFYWECLQYFEATNRDSGTLRVVHALGQMISIWPIEGLAAMRRLVGRTEPSIRRGIIRVLAEAYSRFPAETASLIAQSGGGFTEEEKFSIRCSSDPRLTERSFEQVNWARVLHFLLQTDLYRQSIWGLTEILLKSTSFPEALGKIIQMIRTGSG